MSNPFVLEDEVVNSPRRTYKLDTDLIRGFKLAVNNNQLYRALEYMSLIVEVIERKFSEQDKAFTDQQVEESSLAPSRKITKQAPAPTPPKEEKAGEEN